MGDKLKPITKCFIISGVIILTGIAMYIDPESGMILAGSCVTGFFALMKGSE